jgi:hypothetical protein
MCGTARLRRPPAAGLACRNITATLFKEEEKGVTPPPTSSLSGSSPPGMCIFIAAAPDSSGDPSTSNLSCSPLVYRPKELTARISWHLMSRRGGTAIMHAAASASSRPSPTELLAQGFNARPGPPRLRAGRWRRVS